MPDMRRARASFGLVFAILLAACSEGPLDLGERTSETFESYIKQKPVGEGGDYWIEIRNALGQWERVGLMFGYFTTEGARIECENAIVGLKKVNYDREYRCEPANVP